MTDYNPTDVEEIWKPISIPEFAGLYEASSLGRIRGLAKGKILRPCMSNKGYLMVSLNRKPFHKMATVHSLVAAAFLGARPERLTVNHKDGVKTNNRVDNLEYISYSKNNSHACRLGLKTNYGERASRAKLSNQQVREIRQLGLTPDKFYKAASELARRYGVSSATIYGILRRDFRKIE